jgi:hypothetical protein
MIDSLTLNEQCFSYDHDEKTKDQVTRTPLKTGGELYLQLLILTN